MRQRLSLSLATAWLAIALVAVAPTVFAQEDGVGGVTVEATDDDAGVATGDAVPGTLAVVDGPPRDGQIVSEETIALKMPGTDPLIVYTFTDHGATLKAAVMQFERYTQEARPSLQGVPAKKVAGGPIDLVSTWSARYLPYRVLFKEFSYPEVMKRIVRRATDGVIEGGKLQGSGAKAVKRLVQTGDLLTVTAPANVAGSYTVKGVAFGGTMEVEPAFAVGDATGVAFEVSRQGEMKAIFESDPVFTRVSEKPGLPLVYVWPDPKTDSSSVFIEKRFDAGTHPYELKLTVTLHNTGDKALRVHPSVSIPGWQHPDSGQASMFSRPTDIYSAMCFTGDGLEIDTVHALTDEPAEAFATPTTWVGTGTTYFLLAAAIDGATQPGQCTLAANAVGVVTATWSTRAPRQLPGSSGACLPSWLEGRGKDRACSTAFEALGLTSTAGMKQAREAWTTKRQTPGQDVSAVDAAYEALKTRRRAVYRFKLYSGPKDIEYLAQTSEELKDSLDQGIFAFISKPLHQLLIWLNSIFGSWALAIVFLTIGIKLILLPLTNKSFTAMQKMQKLKPKIDALKKEIGSDRQKLNAEMIALYKREKVNPLGGCLPMLLQMPIWFGLYQTIYSSIELYHAPMGFWITDMSAPDPLYIMPILLGLLMFVQTFLTTSTATMDGMQGKILKFGMPVMFSVFMLFLPSGLVLYILVNTCLTIAQNLVIRKRMGFGGTPKPAKTAA